VKGVGPSMSKAILAERSKGEFKDWADFQKRVKGVGDKTAVKLSQAGLQVNGKAKEGAAMKAEAKPEAKTEAKPEAKAAKSAAAPKDAKAKPAEAKTM